MKLTKKRSFTLYVVVFLLVVILSLILILFLNQDTEHQSTQEKKGTEKMEAENEQDVINEGTRNSGQNQEDMTQTEKNLEQKVEDIIEEMSLSEKIGQLIVVGFPSKQVDEHMTKMINDYHVGGVILYDRNMESPRQVAQLTNELQEMALQTKHKLPLLFSIDQEGGSIVRMKQHVTPIPSQQALGLQDDEKVVYDTAYRTGQELSAMGIHVNFAPVLDLSENDSRSFGTDPNKVSIYGQQVIKGLVDSGMVATLKHFPGHGRSNVDPHVETSSVQANQLDLENNDIFPFKKAIDEMDHQNFFVMVTHIKYPAYDQENPASISPVIIEELLRKKLGYKGIVVTDDLEMGAVNKYFTYEDLGYKAVESGADLLLVCHTLENQQKVFNGILEAVETKKLKEERIDEAVKRILMYKLSSIKNTYVDPAQAEKEVGQ